MGLNWVAVSSVEVVPLSLEVSLLVLHSSLTKILTFNYKFVNIKNVTSSVEISLLPITLVVVIALLVVALALFVLRVIIVSLRLLLVEVLLSVPASIDHNVHLVHNLA